MKAWDREALLPCDGVGWEVEVVELSVVLDGKFGLSGFCREEAAGIGCSVARRRKVSAATIPPIEWPISITCTDGSIVGDGVVRATSRSMTLF